MSSPRRSRKHAPAAVAFALLAAASLAAMPVWGLTEPVDTSSDEELAAECALVQEWYDVLAAEHEAGTAVPLIKHPTDTELQALGLPPAERLVDKRFPEPTLVLPDGSMTPYDISLVEPVGNGNGKGNGGGNGNGRGDGSDGSDSGTDEPAVAAYGGTGCLGIRPGAWMFNLNRGIGLCTLAHVYGAAGNYDISTAGHCTETGDLVTVVAGVGNRDGVEGLVLLDFGRTSHSVDQGIGRDWALIDIFPAYQPLVTPTMCFWGGPWNGAYTETGHVVGVNFFPNPGVSVTPDPDLAQEVVHYGHGLGVGVGGTPRTGPAISWNSDSFFFVGIIAPGDSGSGANTALGQGAGIITHIIVDPIMRDGVGIAAGTRVTQVSGELAAGQIVGYPAPIEGAP